MSKCKSCSASVIWARMALSGTPTPIDPAPHPNGNLVTVDDDPRSPPALGLMREPKMRPATAQDLVAKRPLYKSHFATCPHAADWRRS